MIKYRTEKVIESDDWDKLVRETYNKPYTLQQQNGCMNRGNIYIQVPDTFAESFKTNDDIPLEINGNHRGINFEKWKSTNPDDHKNAMKWSDWQINLFWDRNFYPPLEILANDLCEKGLIEPGNYTINIDW